MKKLLREREKEIDDLRYSQRDLQSELHQARSGSPTLHKTRSSSPGPPGSPTRSQSPVGSRMDVSAKIRFKHEKKEDYFHSFKTSHIDILFWKGVTKFVGIDGPVIMAGATQV